MESVHVSFKKPTTLSTMTKKFYTQHSTAVMLSIANKPIMLSVIRLNVVMLIIVAHLRILTGLYNLLVKY
jgi:hypothetical protein